ncbi:hypothetical protein JTB14_024907 [Gonioctena quinquepunctata]|nr:hypothetical protein JTB14_024907 [Gonioctena quinquepunctata]
MGSSISSSILTEDILEEYLLLTYLNEREIFSLYRMFCTLDYNGTLKNFQYRFPCKNIEELFPELKYNPFKDRIFKVFSSLKDDKMSFEDMLDLCSVMSEKCPAEVKASYAFQIFDFDDDNAVGEDDLTEVMKRLVGGTGFVGSDEQKRIIDILLENMDLTSNGSVGEQEFIHAVGKMPEFTHVFCFRL